MKIIVAIKQVPVRDATMRIETGGRGLDLHPSAPPTKRALDQGRLGVFLMQCLVDDVEARRGEQGKAEVRLVKRRQP